MNLTQYFLQGLKGTLRFNNGKNLSYKGPWVQVFPDTVIDEFFVGDFMAAEYTVCVDAGNNLREIIKCLVVSSPENANLTIYGRTNLGEDLVSLSASVDAAKVSLLANPMTDATVKLIFSSNYYYSIADISSTEL
jgi:hypothetical protein